MINKNNLFKYIFFIVQFSYGQFLYTDYYENEKWFYSNNNNIYFDEDTLNLWKKYKERKLIKYNNEHHFGIFININNKSSSNIIHQKSDLIGNGFLSNYRFSTHNIEISNSMFFTNDRNEANRGFVRTIKNVTMYTNQAYLKFRNSLDSLSYSFKIGRDFLIEGFGNSSNIFFSDFSRPFDQITVEANFKNKFSKFSVINLNDINNHRRYLYLHTFGYKSEKLIFKIGEAVISTGVNESIDIKFLNPLNFWSWENTGSTDEGLNAFLYSGFLWRIKPSLKIYSEVLIDDINFHQSKAFYLNKYAYLFGIKKISFPFNSSIFWIESSNVLNQVYQSFHPSHVFTHRGFPIGHYLGNDFINHRFHYSQLFNSKINKFFIEFSHLIKGQNNLNTPFSNPWEDKNGKFDDTYKHPGFPTPPIEYINDFHLGIEFLLKKYTYLTISLESQKSFEKVINNKLKFRIWSYLNLIK